MKKCLLYSIFLMLATTLIFSSCEKDAISDNNTNGNNSGNNNSGDNDTEEEIGNFFSLKFRVPFDIYTLTKSQTDNGSINEMLIDNVRVVLYSGDVSTSVPVYIWNFHVGISHDGTNFVANGADALDIFYNTTDQSYYVQIKAQTIATVGNYQMLIIVNPNTEIENITATGKTLGDLDTFDPTDTDKMYQTKNGDPAYFLMLNSQGLIGITQSDFKDTKKKAEENPVFGAVERVTAKLGCEFTGPTTKSSAVAPYGRFIMLLDYKNQNNAPWGTDYDIPDDCLDCPVAGCGGKFNRVTKKCSNNPHIHTYDGLGLIAEKVRYMVTTDLTWQVDVVNKKSFWLRKLTNKANGGGMEMQGDNDRKNFYAMDPNFDSFSGTSESMLNNEFSYITATAFNTAKRLSTPSYTYSNYWSWTSSDLTEADTNPVYIPENTMEKDEQRGDVTTRVIFRAILKREQFKDISTYTTLDETLNDNPSSVQRIGDFFVLNGDFQDITQYKYNNYNKDKTTFFILRPEDVKIYESTTNTDDIHIYLRNKILGAIADFKQKYKTTHNGVEFAWNNISSNDSFVTDQLSFYKNGVMYYAVPVEHFTVLEAGGEGEYGRFGVVRNNWYKLNIQNLISIGQPIIPPISTNLLEQDTGNSGGTKNGLDSQIRNQSIIF